MPGVFSIGPNLSVWDLLFENQVSTCLGLTEERVVTPGLQP